MVQYATTWDTMADTNDKRFKWKNGGGFLTR